MSAIRIIKGIATYIPGLYRLKRKGTGGTSSARYCYSVWLRHLVMAHIGGLSTNPRVVAELGPGDSIGIGLAALISGAEKYYAFDIVHYADVQSSIRIFDELVALFQSRADIPGEQEFPDVKPYLQAYHFPASVLTDERMTVALDDARIERIKESVYNMTRESGIIIYKVPWFEYNTVERESVDMVISQAALEHIDDVGGTYRALHHWLRSSGFMSHTLDYSCHGFAEEWNGHWTYSPLRWKLIRGRRPYLLNREPHSRHIDLLKKAGFHIVCNVRFQSESRIGKDDLAEGFRNISKEDLTTSGAFIQARKE